MNELQLVHASTARIDEPVGLDRIIGMNFTWTMCITQYKAHHITAPYGPAHTHHQSQFRVSHVPGLLTCCGGLSGCDGCGEYIWKEPEVTQAALLSEIQ